MIRTLALSVLALPIAAAAPAPKSELLPERTIRCTLGRMTNFDPHREQKTSEIVYEGRHPFALVLPSAPRHFGPPPDATDPAEPVDPRTRIVADPDGLTAGYPKRFDRVIDLWPDRVELSTAIAEPRANVILISDIDPAAKTARIFMAEATDIATYDLDHLYGGDCRIG